MERIVALLELPKRNEDSIAGLTGYSKARRQLDFVVGREWEAVIAVLDPVVPSREEIMCVLRRIRI